MLSTSSETVLRVQAWPTGDRFTFDSAEYDAARDRLRLSRGPETAASAELTPEGHIVRIAAPDGYVCGLTLTDVRARLARDGHVEVTLGPGQRAVLDATDLAGLISHAHAREGRFARRVYV